MDAEKKMTPVMRQYWDIKKKHPDKILFFRMGDFFEMFGEDALKAAHILQIQLTSRSKEKDGAWEMCGVPVHAYEHYLTKLIQAGHKVAICDQVEESSKAKGLVKREVTHSLSPGTAVDESWLNPAVSNYFCAICLQGENSSIELCWVELSCGDIFFHSIPHADHLSFSELDDCLAQYPAKEFLLLSNQTQTETLLQEHLLSHAQQIKNSEQLLVNHVPQNRYSTQKALHAFDKLFAAFSASNSLPAASAELVGKVILYLQEEQPTELLHLSMPKPMASSSFMKIDSVTIRNLEIFHGTNGDPKLGLVALYDQCTTPIGSRLLRRWLTAPLRDVKQINDRLDFVTEALQLFPHWQEIHLSMQKIGDLERTISRFHLPGYSLLHMVKLRNSLRELPKLQEKLRCFQLPVAQQTLQPYNCSEDLLALLERVLLPEPQLKVREGGYICDNVNSELDEYRNIRRDSKAYLAKIEQRVRAESGMTSLKIGFNRIYGYYFEVSHLQAKNLPAHFIRKQTLRNVERYSTPELNELEEKIIQADEKSNLLEEQEFLRLGKQIAPFSKQLKETAAVIAVFDVILTFAKIAKEQNYTRPKILPENAERSIHIEGGRHPMIEYWQKNYPFVRNDLQLNSQDQRTVLITGPNMGGKSTYIRQAALICFLMQTGSYVPADGVKSCLFDRIFTRVGANDSLAEGKSTFMVEMSEASLIAKEATRFSFVVIDELGRGTSTFDGIGIAWGMVEHLTEVGAFTLFATHYHELTKLPFHNPTIQNYHVAVAEQEGSLVFLYKILPGSLNKSYGIYVARQSGMPKTILKRAYDIQKYFAAGENYLLDESLLQNARKEKKPAFDTSSSDPSSLLTK